MTASRGKLADVIPVNPILASISSSVSALPVAAGTGVSVSSQHVGGFTVTLAAAQNLAVAPLQPSHEASGDAQSPLGTAANSNPLAVSPIGSARQNPQPKKSSNGGIPVSANGVVPASAALSAAAMAGIVVPTRVAPSPSLTKNPVAFATAQNPDTVTGSVGKVSASTSQSSDQSAGGSLPPARSAETGSGAVQSTSQVSTSSSIALPTTASPLTGGQCASIAGNAQSSVFSTAQPTVSTVATANADSDLEQRSSATQPSADPTRMAGNLPPALVSFAAGQSSSTAGQAAPEASSTNAMPTIPAELISETDQAIAAAAPEAIVAANAPYTVGYFVVSQQSSPLRTAAASPSAANYAPDGSAVSALEAQAASQPVVATEAESQFSAIVNAPVGEPPIASAPSSSLSARASARPVASKASAEDAPENHGVVPAPSSGASRGSSSADGPPAASQSPFAVFFSDPGAGAATAVSALPKVILPGNAATHASSSTPSVVPGGNPPSSSHNNVAPNVGAQASKEPPSASQSENSPAAPPPRKDVDANGANAALDSAPNSVAPVAVAPALAAPVPIAVVPQSSIPANPGDALPKADGTQAGAENSGAPVPVMLQAVAVALPGPVQMAQMVNRVGQAEMRIGMNTSAFGSVEVRTVVHASDVGVIIGSEKGDLRTLLANEMPVITDSLQQQSLRLNSVNFMQGFAFSNNQSGGGESQQRSFVPVPSPTSSGSSEVAGDDAVEIPTPPGFVGSSNSLSILA